MLRAIGYIEATPFPARVRRHVIMNYGVQKHHPGAAAALKEPSGPGLFKVAKTHILNMGFHGLNTGCLRVAYGLGETGFFHRHVINTGFHGLNRGFH